MIDQIYQRVREKMHQAITITRQDLASLRSGRASPALVENIVISVYGGSQKLKLRELATITTMDTKTLVIAPFDPTVIREIEKGILETNVGLTPVVEADLIRITIPPLSEERRQEYIKLTRTKLEAGRILIRQIRHNAIKELKNSQDQQQISEDQKAMGEKMIQALTDEMIAEIAVIGENKEQELLQI